MQDDFYLLIYERYAFSRHLTLQQYNHIHVCIECCATIIYIAIYLEQTTRKPQMAYTQ